MKSRSPLGIDLFHRLRRHQSQLGRIRPAPCFPRFRDLAQDRFGAGGAQPSQRLDRLQSQDIRSRLSASLLPQCAASACRPMFLRSCRSHPRRAAESADRDDRRAEATAARVPDDPLAAICRTTRSCAVRFHSFMRSGSICLERLQIHPRENADRVDGLVRVAVAKLLAQMIQRLPARALPSWIPAVRSPRGIPRG